MKCPHIFSRSLFSFVLFTISQATLPAGPGEPRPLRYHPDGADFVIKNGTKAYNRPLYAGNTGFRVEASDRPELALFCPGRGGNVRFAARPAGGQGGWLWLHQAADIKARYRPGSMVYEIRQASLGNGQLLVTVLPMAGKEGMLARVEWHGNSAAPEMFWAFGGGDGHVGRRNGDMNAESEPLDKFHRFVPARAKGHKFTLDADGFRLPLRTGTLIGYVPAGATISIAEANHWDDASALLASTGAETKTPLVVGRMPITDKGAVTLGFHLVRPKQKPVMSSAGLAAAYDEAEAFRQSLAGRLAIDTPDDYFDAAAAALGVAGDAIWDEKSSAYMHGACGWRMPLLGWRGAYAGNVMGWHDRTRRHIDGFASRQITAAPPATMPPADEKYNLARNETALLTHGEFAVVNPRHYNMNLIGVDTFFRHMLWTGDMEFAKRMWPVLERHFEREHRLFRRPYGSDGLPLYEAYAAIWASDELIYNGGGTTHGSAYAYWHHLMAARIAEKLGKDPTPHKEEAARILQAMRRELWLSDRGWWAEFRDWLGKRASHDSPALWSFYHTIDSEVATPMEAWQASRFIETRLARIPVHGPGVPAGLYAQASSDWMPYQWSINNVALPETAHTALALWQTGRGEFATEMLKGALVESMFQGDCPGNVGLTSTSDRYCGERYRDFSDPVGITARAMIEGMFGIRPDALDGKLRVRPGWPAAWPHARLRQQEVSMDFQAKGDSESYTITSRFPSPMALELEIPARRESVAALRINGKAVDWKPAGHAVGRPYIAITAEPAQEWRVEVTWAGAQPMATNTSGIVAVGEAISHHFAPAKPLEIADPQGIFKQGTLRNGTLSATIVGRTGHRTAFVKLRQGNQEWWQPLAFDVRPALEIVAAAEQPVDGFRIRIRHNLPKAWKGQATVNIAGQTRQIALDLPARGTSDELPLPADGLSPGSHPIVITLGSENTVAGTLVNWKLRPPAKSNWEPVDMSAVWNAKVTDIFKNEYRSPRSPFCSLALPKQGYGGWCHYKDTVEINDSGLRAAAGSTGLVQAPELGIPFRTAGPGEAPNILFTTLWDNYPDEASLPLRGRASRAVLLMAGSTYAMQSRFDNGEVVVTYHDGSSSRLVLHSPVNWWPIDQDYHIDKFAFARAEPVPPRLNLQTGKWRVLEPSDLHLPGKPLGGAATVLDLPLDPTKELASLTLRCLGNEVVIGLMAVTLEKVPAK